MTAIVPNVHTPGGHTEPGVGALLVDENSNALGTAKNPLFISGGDASAANQLTEITALGAVTETAPATDTASSGLNGRLQRIAQRLTSLIALLPASLGIKTAAGSLSIAPASDAVFFQ